MAAIRPLAFHRQIFADLLVSDGMLLMGKGMGLDVLIQSLMEMYCEPGSLVFVLNGTARETAALVAALEGARCVMKPRMIDNQTTPEKRRAIYLEGGVCIATSRILVVDMLNKVVPLDLVTGFLVLNAHSLAELCTETFILRLFRAENKDGFVKAFSDSAVALARGLNTMEKVLANLHLRQMLLWPRFHVAVVAALNVEDQQVLQVSQPLSPHMLAIQSAVVVLMAACLAELVALNRLDSADLSIESALETAFDQIIRQQLDSVWHKLGTKTKQLIGDLRTLRSLLHALLAYDCVTFLCLVEALRATSGAIDMPSMWLFMDAADTLFTAARARVYRRVRSRKRRADDEPADDPPEFPAQAQSSASAAAAAAAAAGLDDSEYIVKDVPTLDPNPKWALLTDVLMEVEAAVAGARAHVLVFVADSRTRLQIQQVLAVGADAMLRAKYEDWQRAQTTARDVHVMAIERDRAAGAAADGNADAYIRLSSLEKRTAAAAALDESAVETALADAMAAGAALVDVDADTGHAPMDLDDGDTAAVVGDTAPAAATVATALGPAVSDAEYAACFGLVDATPGMQISIHVLGSPRAVLEATAPDVVILYNFSIEAVRAVEVYAAGTPNKARRVYFLSDKDSLEEQQYLTALRREAEAFERLIRANAAMMPAARPLAAGEGEPTEAALLSAATAAALGIQAGGEMAETRRSGRGSAGGAAASAAAASASAAAGGGGARNVIVDVREFRALLPFALHQRGLGIVPVTLEVGDYVLAPDMVLERKSLSDLISSLRSGRLYAQAEAMTRFYAEAILLIEFTNDQPFALQPASDIPGEISVHNVISKLVLLTLHFPKLRVLWARSPHHAAEMIEAIKANRGEPDAAVAARIGADADLALHDDTLNFTAVQVLQRLPGVTRDNVNVIANAVESLAELAALPLARLTALIGEGNGAKLFQFLHLKPKLVPKKGAKPATSKAAKAAKPAAKAAAKPAAKPKAKPAAAAVASAEPGPARKKSKTT